MTNFWQKRAKAWYAASLVIVCFTLTTSATAQSAQYEADSVYIRNIFNRTLTDGRSYAWLEYLTQRVGHRLSGSPAAEKAVRWGKAALDTLGLDSVWLQPVMVPHWVRGAAERVRIQAGKKRAAADLHALALGGSVATPAAGLQAQVVEIKNWDELDKLGHVGIAGKIVFYNRPMDPTKIRTFEAYGGAVDQRVQGASRASKYGAVGVLVRSMSLRLDDYPHTGTLIYDSTYALIPAAAISTNDAEKLGKLLRSEPDLKVFMKLNCQTLPEAPSFNVIGELRGTEQPEQVILVGGHLDSWDVGEGAHDDGAGIVQSMEVLRTLKRMGYRPRHTLRCVMFMNEENGSRGGKMYAKESKRKGEFPLASIESDAGGFTPRGFGFEGDGSVFAKFYETVKNYESLFTPYGFSLSKGGGGADIGPLRDQKGLLSGYSPDSQRYFDIHHTAADVFSAVNKRELELGAAGMTALVYLLDKYGL